MLCRLLLSIAVLSIATFLYDVQAAPTAVAVRDSVDTTTAIDTLSQSGSRVKRQGGGCGCGCGCGCCGCGGGGGGGGGGGCGCCCCRPRCCCRRCCTCCRTCCTTRCCTCCRPCCGCGCGCGGGGRKRRSLQNLKIQHADAIEKQARENMSERMELEHSHEEQDGAAGVEEKLVKRNVQTSIGSIVDIPESPNAYGYY